jgi:hypothetical protein
MLKLEDLKSKSLVKLKINGEYVLPEDEQKILKEEVEKTLGEEDKGTKICTMGKEDALQFIAGEGWLGLPAMGQRHRRAVYWKSVRTV